jgi:hypothetical protein
LRDHIFWSDRLSAVESALSGLEAFFIVALTGNSDAANQIAALQTEATRASANSTICRADAGRWL